MIEGYLGSESVRRGQRLAVHVCTTSDRFRVDFYRLSAELEFVGSSQWFTGVAACVPPHPYVASEPASPAVDWNWPRYEHPVPVDWPTGLYLAVFVEESGHREPCTVPNSSAAVQRFGRASFVVRPRPGEHAARVLYKRSTFTRHAYNQADNGSGTRSSSLYDNPVYTAIAGHPRGHKVSMRRPGSVDDVAQWDAPFVRWLAVNGYAVDFCTDLDLHESPDMLARYRLLLSVGHDEYWTEAMRDNVERFVAAGGNVAFFSGNTCWWRTHVTDDATAIVSDTDHYVEGVFPHLPATDQWWPPPPDGVGRPENALTGVSFRNGGVWPGDWPGDRPRDGFAVQHAAHWVFAGTGLRDGTGGAPQDFLGAGTPLIGYECDGAAFEFDSAGVPRATGADGTPESFLILGLALLDPVNEDYYNSRPGHWKCPPREPAIASPRAATMGIYTTGGTVFTAGTTDWPAVVGNLLDANVEQVTRNVLDRLG